MYHIAPETELSPLALSLIHIYDCKVATADLDALYVDNAVVRVELAVGLFVRLGHAAAGLHHQMCIRDSA